MLIVQDDVEFCRNFAEAVERIAAANPDLPVILFVSDEARITSRTMREHQRRRLRDPYVLWSRQDHLPVVATLWPRHLAVDFHEWALENPRAVGHTPRSDDAMGCKWAKRRKQQVLVTVPSLVQHPDRESLIKDPNRFKLGRRTASIWIGDADPLAIDWSRR